MMDIKNHDFQGVFYRSEDAKTILTKNLTPGKAVYGEKLVQSSDTEYRIWDPHRSKLAAYILGGGKTMPIQSDSRVLYLGAASGTTASHVSDIAAKGLVYCIEFSARVARDLIPVCESRKNMVPILADANQPSRYSHIVNEADVIYQDVAQKNQTEIFAKNAGKFLKDGGIGVLMLKAKSIDIAEKSESLFRLATDSLQGKGFTVIETVNLMPYQKDHEAIIIKK
jgi:fibrillarin-like pre-rRNA processing protein